VAAAAAAERKVWRRSKGGEKRGQGAKEQIRKLITITITINYNIIIYVR
jgi:hypothetical protein